jgi:hypothetical protein
LAASTSNAGSAGGWALPADAARGEKPRLFEQASSCRGAADYDPTPFVGPFPLLTTRGDYLIGDFAALGFCLLATCPGGRERLIDPRDATWHHLHRRSLATLRLH